MNLYKTEVTIHNIFTSPEHHYFTREKFDVGNAETIGHDSIDVIAGYGLKGDRFEFSKYPITLFSLEVAKEICSSLELELDVKLFRRNIIISGVHLNSLIGKRFKIGDMELEGLAHCAPCTWMNAVMKKGAYSLMSGRGGLRVKVISNGTLHKGDTILQSDEALNENILEPLKKPKLPF